MQNGYTDFPMFGGIKGFSSDSPDLASGSYNYLYLGGVSESESKCMNAKRTS